MEQKCSLRHNPNCILMYKIIKKNDMKLQLTKQAELELEVQLDLELEI